MDIQHLPFEHPSTYKRVRDVLVGAMVPGLEAVLLPVWATLPPRDITDPARRTALIHHLLHQREQLQKFIFEYLNPVKGFENRLERSTLGRSAQGDAADTLWELVVWLLDGLLQKEFPGRKVKDSSRQGAPFFLYQLARKLADLDDWKPNHAAVCLQGVISDLSAEHTRERLQWYYGQGGDHSVNRITQVLRPVDKHQNRALGLLANPAAVEDAVDLVLGTAYSNESFRVRQVTRRKVPMPAQWLMNWTDAFDKIQQILQTALIVQARSKGNKQRNTNQSDADDVDDADDPEKLTPLSRNKDVYIKTNGRVNFEGTKEKITDALNQLHALRQMGGAMANRVELGELLDRLNEGDQNDDGQDLAEPASPSDSGAAPTMASNPLKAVLECLDTLTDDLLQVAALLRICARLPDKCERLALQAELVPMWEEKGIFQRVGVKPGIAGLTEARLAMASRLGLPAFKQKVQAVLAEFDTASARAGEAAEADQDDGYPLRHVGPPMVRVAATLRLLRRLPSAADMERCASDFWVFWNNRNRFDGGLLSYLGLVLSDPPKNPDRWASEALDLLTDEVLAWGCDCNIDDFIQQVAQALEQFDSADATDSLSHSTAPAAQEY